MKQEEGADNNKETESTEGDEDKGRMMAQNKARRASAAHALVAEPC